MPCDECEKIRKQYPGALCGECAGSPPPAKVVGTLYDALHDAEARLAKVIELHHNGGLGVLDGGLGYPSGWCTCCGDCWPCQTYRAAKGE